MNKMISCAKIMFIGFAIYVSIGMLRNMLGSITLLFQDLTLATVGIVIASFSVTFGLMALVIYVFVLKRDKWARKLIAKDIEPDQVLDTQLTLTMAFRLVSVGAGFYTLNAFMWSFSGMIMKLIMTMKYQPQDGTVQMFTGGFSPDYVQPVLYLLLAVYLLCGAPHFVRWQVKKTMQFCDQTGKTD